MLLPPILCQSYISSRLTNREFMSPASDLKVVYVSAGAFITELKINSFFVMDSRLIRAEQARSD